MTTRTDIFPRAQATPKDRSDSAGRRTSPCWVIQVSGALSFAGTSSAEPDRLWEAPTVSETDATASRPQGEWHFAPPIPSPESARRAITELRRISGLTWDELATLFGVSRRSVHFWASGKPLNAANEQRLMRVLRIVRSAHRDDARATRTALLESRDGPSAFDMLVEGRLDEAQLCLGVDSAGVGRSRSSRPLDHSASQLRQPPYPDRLIDARHDRIHRDLGNARGATTARNKPRGQR